MTLLVAYDDSHESQEALAYATDIADAMNGSITLAYAVEPAVREAGGSEPITGIADAGERLFVEDVADTEMRGEKILEAGAHLAEKLGYDARTELLYGDPVTALTDFAEQEAVDTIFVGHRGRSERTDLLLGSVAKAVVERATVPVTVVR